MKRMRIALWIAVLVMTVVMIQGCLPVKEKVFNVTGTVTEALDKTQGVEGVTIVFNRGLGTVETDAEGRWQKEGLTGAVKVTPSLAGWSFYPPSVTVNKAATNVNFVGIEGGPILLFEDFSAGGVGQPPLGWERLIPSDVPADSITVITDAEKGSVVRFQRGAVSQASNKNVQLYTDLLAVSDAEPDEVTLEFSFRWVNGAFNVYIEEVFAKSNIHLVIHDGGTFRVVRPKSGGGTEQRVIGNVQDGWNHVRVVANKETDQLRIYLNESTSNSGPYDFRVPLDTWNDTVFRIIDGGTIENAEAYFTDILIYY